MALLHRQLHGHGDGRLGACEWTVKRRQKLANPDRPYFGFRLVERLNIASIAGLSIAMTAFLWGNRLLPHPWDGRADLEVNLFFTVWALALVHALLRPARSAWVEQLWAASALLFLLPVLNALTTQRPLWRSLFDGDGFSPVWTHALGAGRRSTRPCVRAAWQGAPHSGPALDASAGGGHRRNRRARGMSYLAGASRRAWLVSPLRRSPRAVSSATSSAGRCRFPRPTRFACSAPAPCCWRSVSWSPRRAGALASKCSAAIPASRLVSCMARCSGMRECIHLDCGVDRPVRIAGSRCPFAAPLCSIMITLEGLLCGDLWRTWRSPRPGEKRQISQIGGAQIGTAFERP